MSSHLTNMSKSTQRISIYTLVCKQMRWVMCLCNTVRNQSRKAGLFADRIDNGKMKYQELLKGLVRLQILHHANFTATGSP
jgi:hypothetical protein